MDNFSGYILIKASEDGEPVRWLTHEDLEELMSNDPPSGIEKFLTVDDLDSDGLGTSSETAYWPEEQAMLLKVEAVVPQPVEVVSRYKI